MKFLRVSQVSELTGLHPSSLRRIHQSGELVPEKITAGKTRYYSEEQIIHYLKGERPNNRIIIGYCRVSSSSQKNDLERQVDRMKQYLIARGYQFEIIEDIGSGINYKKKGFNKLMERIENNEVEKVVIMHKDRLVRFGYELVEKICQLHGTAIEVIDNTAKTEEQEVVEDLVQIITVFSCKLQGKRSKKTKQIIKELTSDDIGEESQTDSNA
ncbi:IS607 family transposase [Bacillus mycoides]|uniref:IS607 family transposase n=1 Tax=Bacillus mycoides TaxID=1405 RepID=UPI003D6533F2